MGNCKEDKALLLRFNIRQTLQIRLTRLKVNTYSKHGAKPHKCHLCKYSSKVKTNLKNHLRFHTGEKPFSCTLCTYKSSRHHVLNDHIRKHTGEKPWNCVFCKTSFKRNYNKTCHEKTCKLNPGQQGLSWVEMQRKYKCLMCPYSTVENSNLKRHMMTHTGEKLFTCNLCNHKLRSRTQLQSHILTHTGEKPYNCQFCIRGFVQVAHQKIHEKICKLNPQQGDAKWVEEQKKFKCHFCTYKTLTKRSLETHLRSHTGEKPYKCLLCSYKCSDNSSLNKHLRRKHVKEDGYKCPECDFTSLSTSKLLNHLKKFHVKL